MFSFSDTGMSWDFARHSGALFRLGRGGDRRNGGYLRHGAVHGGLPGMQIEGLGGGHLRVAQNAGEGEHIHAVLDGAGGKGVAQVVVAGVGQVELFQHLAEIVAEVIRVCHAPLGVVDHIVLRTERSEQPHAPLVLEVQKLRHDGRNGHVPFAVRAFGRAEHQLGGGLAVPFHVGLVRQPLDGAAKADLVAVAVHLLPAQGADLAQAAPGVQRQQNAHVLQVIVLEQKALQSSLRRVGQRQDFGTPNLLDHGGLHRVVPQTLFLNGLLEGHIQHNAHVLDAFGAERTAGFQIPMVFLVVEKRLKLCGGDRLQRRVPHGRDDVAGADVPVLGIAGGLGRGLDIGFQPVDKPPGKGECVGHGPVPFVCFLSRPAGPLGVDLVGGEYRAVFRQDAGCAVTFPRAFLHGWFLSGDG